MAQIRLRDDSIQQLIQERKPVPSGLFSGRVLTSRNGHFRKDYSLAATTSGSEFVVKLRQSVINPADFSVILGYKMPGLYTVFRLRRYNGKHTHTNIIEGNSFHDFHIHTATERYQKKGLHEDYFAEISTRHYDLQSAVECLIRDCGFDTTFSDLPLFRNQP
jgi:hypothetical protein